MDGVLEAVAQIWQLTGARPSEIRCGPLAYAGVRQAYRRHMGLPASMPLVGRIEIAGVPVVLDEQAPPNNIYVYPQEQESHDIEYGG